MLRLSEEGDEGIVVDNPEFWTDPKQDREARVETYADGCLMLCDQVSGAPSGVPAQSLARIRSPISPPPESHGKFTGPPKTI